MSRVFPSLVAAVLVASSFVRNEPAPYDYGMAVVVVLGLFAGSLRYPRTLRVPGALLAAFIALNGVSLLNAGALGEALRSAFIRVYLAVSGVFFAGVLARYGDSAYQWIWRGYLAAGLIAATLGWLGVAGVPGFERHVWGELRSVAEFQDPNVYGAFLVPVILYALHRLRWSKGGAVLAWGTAFGLLVAGQVLSLSRAAWLNLVVALAIYGVLSRQVNWRAAKRAGLGAAMAAGWLGIAIAMNPGIPSATEQRVGLMGYDQDRFAVQAEIPQVIRARPWGIGPGETERFFAYTAHNLYLRVLVENGWLAGAAFFALLGFCVWTAIKLVLRNPPGPARSAHAAIAAALLGTLVNSLFIDSLHWRHFWLLLALALGPWMLSERGNPVGAGGQARA